MRIALEQPAAAMQFGQDVAQRTVEHAATFAGSDENRHRGHQGILERHAVAGPVVRQQGVLKNRRGIQKAVALLVVQRQQGVAHRLVGLQIEQVALGHRLVEIAALDRAQGAIADAAPLTDRLPRPEHHVHAGFVIARLDGGGAAAPFGCVADGGNQDVDLAQRQFLEPVFGGDLYFLECDAQALGDQRRHIALESDHFAGGIDRIERLEIGLHANPQHAALADGVKNRAGRRGLGAQRRGLHHQDKHQQQPGEEGGRHYYFSWETKPGMLPELLVASNARNLASVAIWHVVFPNLAWYCPSTIF